MKCIVCSVDSPVIVHMTNASGLIETLCFECAEKRRKRWPEHTDNTKLLEQIQVTEAERDAFRDIAADLLAFIAREVGWSRHEDQMLVARARAYLAGAPTRRTR